MQTLNSLGFADRALTNAVKRTGDVAGLTNQWLPLFMQFDSNHSYEKYKGVAYFPAATGFVDGKDAAEVNMTPQYTATITPTLFGALHTITIQAMQTDQFGLFDNRAAELRKSMEYAKALFAANFIGGGFSATTAADGVALFSASHTNIGGGANYSSVDTAASLSYISLESLSNVLVTQKDPTGRRMRYSGGTYLLVPRELELRSRRILRSQQIAGSNNNDVNVLVDTRGIELLVSDCLGDSAGSTTQYIMVAKRKDATGLRWVDQVPITPKTFSGKMGEITMSLQSSWACAAVDAYGLAGNAGA